MLANEEGTIVSDEGCSFEPISFFIRWRGKVSGPFTPEQIGTMLRDGRITKHHQASTDRMAWKTIDAVEALQETFAAAYGIKKTPTNQYPDNVDSTKKSTLKIVRDKLPAQARWYYTQKGEVCGPVALEDLQGLITEGTITKKSPVCREGEETWMPVSDAVGLPASPQTAAASPVRGGIYCGKCGEPNDANAYRCVRCNEVLQAAGPGLRNLSSAPAQPMMLIRPPTYLAHTILATLFCCLPLGIVGIVYASQVSSRINAGDYHGAVEASGKARMWGWIAAVVGFGLWFVLGFMEGFFESLGRL